VGKAANFESEFVSATAKKGQAAAGSVSISFFHTIVLLVVAGRLLGMTFDPILQLFKEESIFCSSCGVLLWNPEELESRNHNLTYILEDK
jgi:hypothetical protein